MDHDPPNENFFDPLSEDFRNDPYPAYEKLRETRPLEYNRFLRTWIVSRYADVEFGLKDPRFVTLPLGRMSFALGARRSESDKLREQRAHSLLHLDPPAHTRLRNLVRKAFTPRRVEQLTPRIRAEAQALLEPLHRDGGMDVMKDYAYPLPVRVICRMLGVPSEDVSVFPAWSEALARGLDPLISATDVEAANAAAEGFHDYFSELIRNRRRDLGDDLLSALIRVEEEGDQLNETEMIATAVLLLVAGHETTMNLIGNGLSALLQNSAEIRSFRTDLSVALTAVDEILRFDSPVQMTARRAREEVVMRGETLKKGSYLIFLLASANYDHRVFEDPQRFDTGRDPNPHLALSTGIHFCLGARLARFEGAIALQELFSQGRIRPVGRPTRRATVNIRGFSNFPIELGA